MRAETNLRAHSTRVLFIAAEMGNTTFLVELIRKYPDLIWKVNDNNLSIFHIAVNIATKEVEKMIPPSYRERKNRDGLTPHELFTMEHKELVIQGEKWMKDTASQCMVVAALIATIVFAAAFTVPGGMTKTMVSPYSIRSNLYGFCCR
ncbi:putative PGG domain-containing protein [Helianthus annuus]|nr:putative PGG domain-containing protein [Helianthus annuus]